jgi:hypothetical protein
MQPRPALLGLITAVAGLEVVQLVTRPDQDTWRLGARTMLRIALVHLAGLFTHPTYAFVLGATTLAALVHGGTARPVAAWAGSLAAAVYAVTWWPALHTTTGSAATASIGPPVLADLGTTLQILWGSLPGLLVLLSVAAFSALRLRESRGMPPAPALRAMMIVAVTVLVAPFVASSWLAVFVPSGIAVLLLPSACVCVALLVVPRGNAIVMGALAAALLTSAIVQVAHS